MPFTWMHARRTALVLAAAAAPFAALPARAQDAAALKARHAQLQPQLVNNAYGRPLHIASSDTSDTLRGDVHAVVSHPYAGVTALLRTRANWCDILILPFNVKQCLAPAGSDTLGLRIGRKFDQPVEDAHPVDFRYREVHAGADHFEVQLTAAEGPLGTRDYRIVVEAVPLDGQRTFVRLSYSYGFGMAARLAMQAYLATTGSDKVGFSVTGPPKDGTPAYVKGVRGVVERNAMRYFLAIEAYLDAPTQADRRIRDWFRASEQYALQLHEMDEAQYVAMKTKEVARQKARRG